MPKRMLIDASHPEETRVVVLDGQRVEEFDFEAASKRPLKGNIYLAKVTRVEPSLQAAFVEYGGNRQGFLAFSEIHPDYYQIPVADRQALLAEQEQEARSRSEDDIESFDMSAKKKRGRKQDAEEAEAGEENGSEDAAEPRDEITAEAETETEEQAAEAEAAAEEAEAETTEREAETDAETAEGEPASAEAVEAEPVPEGEEKSAPKTDAQALEAKRPSQRWMRRRHYKIQEVIKRRQIILVQVVKEERGNKGAALTTYLSLAGRYCVLMPNTPRGGGISRKITNATDRKRLKAAAQALDLPEGMGLIIRTAGENRTKLEIKRDYEYLLRLWDTIRELTLKSNAPACVYEEGDLVKRVIRDLYNKDVTEVVVEGEEGYRNAKDFMRMLMPSHAKNVKPYKEPVPLFQRHHIEAQLDAMFSQTVTLKSGGYIVINQTEALVAIDVNSGRATREHNIEDTATKTNLEAADEIGRQLRLRDLAGLIVIDFIDMEDSRNDRAVEKRLHNAVKNDRARIQIGKISQFGLMEMSRQRLRAGVIAGSTVPCPHCGGQGIVRSVESTALRVLRGLEEEAQKQRCDSMIVHVAADVGFYTLNQKRAELARLENEYDVTVAFEPKENLKAGDFEIDRIGQRDPSTRPKLAALEPPPEPEPEEAEAEEETAVEAGSDTAEAASGENRDQREGEGEGRDGGRRRRRRRRRGGRGRDRDTGDFSQQNGAPQPAVEASPAAEGEDRDGDSEGAPEAGAEAPQGERQPGESQGDGQGEGGRRRRRRRRGRRGGRDRDFNNGEPRENTAEPLAADAPAPLADVPVPPVEAPAPLQTSFRYYEDRFGNVDEIDTTPTDEPRGVIPNAASTPVWTLESELDTTPAEPPKPVVSPAPAMTETAPVEPAPVEPAKPVETPEPVADTQPEPAATKPAKPAPEPAAAKPAEPAPEPAAPAGPPKKGWWQRTFRTE
ncbi:Rne/Rng family ribonuclease [Rhizomicrobium electricum]|uniref:Ribonuclease E n=1 Tax=Rhizomicrobium electricum TaxID=480070 RepID=A0ABN1F942_9PROT|nr:Rne/Rng family ribonuclease [Rhizomicrobium electricum]NIJ46805.1 ribonuclease E [Rhizomicrobium electricum]